VRVRLFGGKWLRRRSKFKRAGHKTKRRKSLAARRLSGKCYLTGCVLARALTSIKEVLSRAELPSQGQDHRPAPEPLAARATAADRTIGVERNRRIRRRRI
jgi:hypothetical protein